jgi:hypothetical protein
MSNITQRARALPDTKEETDDPEFTLVVPTPTLKEAENLYNDMVVRMMGASDCLFNLIGKSLRSSALHSLLVGCSLTHHATWEELDVARIRFDFPYQLLQSCNETKKFISTLYTDPFNGLEDSPLIPKDLRKSLNIILSSYPEIDRF